MARYLIAVDTDEGYEPRSLSVVEAKSFTEAVEVFTGNDDATEFDVYRIAAGPKRARIESETIRKVVLT